MTDYLTTSDIMTRCGCGRDWACKIARRIAAEHNISKTGRDWHIPAALVEQYQPARVGRPKGQIVMNKRLKELLKQNNAEFNWDRKRKVFCLSGPADGQGLGWEGEDMSAPTKKAAEEWAAYYLEHGEW